MKTTFAVHWHYGVATHSGWFRMKNEDRSLLRIGTTDKGEPYAVAVIADGMGGIGNGSLASESALESVKLWLDGHLVRLLQHKEAWIQLESSVEQLFHEINKKLLQQGKEAGKPLGTTLTLLFLLNETYFICHVGDCRIYYINRRYHVRQMTKDQSWAAEQVRKGRLTKLQARKHPKRHVLLHSLGLNSSPELVKQKGFYSRSSMFLLCTDGFYDRLTESGMAHVLREGDASSLDLQQISDLLIDKALDRRSNDNISVMLLRPLQPLFAPHQRIWHRMKNFHMIFPAVWRK